jgi:hypothetical protein
MSRSREPIIIETIRRHEGVVIIFGAFLLAGTFILKEIVGENLKDLKDSLDQAENSFRIRTEFLALREKMGVLGDQLTRLEAQNTKSNVVGVNTKGQGPLPDDGPQMPSGLYGVNLLKDELRPVEEEMQNIDDLVEKTPLSGESARQLQECRDHLTDVREAVSKERDQLRTRDGKPLGGMIGSMLALASVSGVRAEISLLARSVNYLVPKVLEIAKQQEKKKEHDYSVVKWINFVCFLIGLSLAALGKWFDVGVIGGA